MATTATQTLARSLDAFKKVSSVPAPDVKACATALAALKVALLGTAYLTPSASGSQEELLLIRESLELGALYAIQSKDTPAFERFMAQLKVYYNPSNFGKVTVPVSQRMASLLGLNLLRLLTQNKIAEFHTELELLPASLLETVYIQHPMQIEQSLMEGAFNKVWHSRANVPAKEYLYFIDILMGTIRNEIADCSEKAYEGLPVSDAATLLYFKTAAEATAFFEKRGWTVSGTRIQFAKETGKDGDVGSIPSLQMTEKCLEYAREMERIV